jgi:SAM domain (Sterile alpha motif)
MSEIRKWLEAIGLGQYAEAFEANHIDMDLLEHVDDQPLKDIGIASAGLARWHTASCPDRLRHDPPP